MTEQERKQLIDRIALQIGRAQFGDWVINPTEKMREQARTALAVAEPVIREEADTALREENARLREALEPIVKIKAFTWINEWTPVEALRDDEAVNAKLTGAQIKKMREAAIREGSPSQCQ